MSELSRWSLMDERLLQCFANHMSPDQVENELDIPAAEAALRAKRLLRSRDIWTEVEEQRLLLESLYALKAKAERALDPDNPKSLEANMKILDTIGKRLDGLSAGNKQDIEKITSVQAAKLVQLFVRATEHAKTILSEQYPDAILDDIDEALQDGLRRAAQAEEIEA